MQRGILKAVNRGLPGVKFASADGCCWFEDFYFIQAADTQLGMMYFWEKGTFEVGPSGTPYPDSKWDEEIELCKQSVEIVNSLRPKPAFFIVCGDLVDAFASQYPEIRMRQEADLKSIYSGLDPDIPMVCVCGNHDVGNQPTHETIETYKKSFGDDYFSFYLGGVAFIIINSQFYEDASKVEDLYREHEDWLEKELKTAAEKKVNHVLVFQHIPWFINECDEPKEYFNIEKELRLKKLEQLNKAGVKKVFCGHYHRNAGGWYKDLEVVITSAIGCQLGTDEHGMRLVKITKEDVNHEYHALDNFPTRVLLDRQQK